MTVSTGGRSRNLILAAMIFAVAMTFIDQTIVSIAVPEIQKELGLSSTGVQWAVNAYLLTLAAFFAFGGRLADTVGHRTMVTLGVIVFAGASALCGLTPKGSVAEAWIVIFRAVQGLGGAIMFPAALAIVVQTFALRERGRALALFFGIAGGLTAIGPVLVGAASAWVHDQNAAAQQAERSWHRVTAVLLQAVPGPLMSDNGANTWIMWTPARWTADGRRHVGQVPAAAGSSAGSTVSVWLDRAGNVQAPPLSAVQIRDRVVLAAVVALTALAVFLTAVTLIGRRLLDRRRLAGWAADWLSVGPQWSRRG